MLDKCIGKLNYYYAVLRVGMEIEPALERMIRDFMDQVAAVEPTPKRAPRFPTRLEHLTPREIEVLSCLEAGLRPRHVAAYLVISIDTVNMHIRHAAGKLHVHGYMAAVRMARVLGILSRPSH